MVGTYDSRVPPILDEQIGRLVALVHLERADDRDIGGQRVAGNLRENWLLSSL